MKEITVALLFGGKSNEHEVSCRSAATILVALQAAGYRVLPIGITQSGGYYLYQGEAAQLGSAAWEDSPDLIPLWFGANGNMMTEDGRIFHPHVAFPLLHGQYGEDGKIQGFLESLGIPYIGCDISASLFAWDKVVAKKTAADMGIPTLPWVETSRVGAETVILKNLSFPIFIKPVVSGSSVGAGRADTTTELTHILNIAAETAPRIMAEPCFSGREIEVAILSDGEAVVSRVGEIAPNNTFYDYDTKYRTDTARIYIPARIPDRIAAQARDYALRIFHALGCRHLARVDFFATDELIFFNEINTMPGFTSASMYPCLMEDNGIPLETLVKRLVEAARA